MRQTLKYLVVALATSGVTAGVVVSTGMTAVSHSLANAESERQSIVYTIPGGSFADFPSVDLRCASESSNAKNVAGIWVACWRRSEPRGQSASLLVEKYQITTFTSPPESGYRKRTVYPRIP